MRKTTISCNRCGISINQAPLEVYLDVEQEKGYFHKILQGDLCLLCYQHFYDELCAAVDSIAEQHNLSVDATRSKGDDRFPGVRGINAERKCQ